MPIIRLQHPLHGFTNVYSDSEADVHATNGWSRCGDPEPAPKAVTTPTLEDQYFAKFGKKPHHKMKPENIQKALDDDSQ